METKKHIGYNLYSQQECDDDVFVYYLVDKAGNRLIDTPFSEIGLFGIVISNKSIIPEYAIIRENKNYGVIDKTGKLVVEPKYESQSELRRHILPGIKEKEFHKYGQIEDKNLSIIYVEQRNNSSELFPVSELYAVIDSLNNVVIPFGIYNLISNAIGTLLLVRECEESFFTEHTYVIDLWGNVIADSVLRIDVISPLFVIVYSVQGTFLYNLIGQKILTIDFTQVCQPRVKIFFDYFLAIEYNNYSEPDYILYNIKGEIVPNVPTFKTIRQFNGGHLLLDGHIIYSINGGLIDLPYDYVCDFVEGYAIVVNKIETQKENRYGDYYNYTQSLYGLIDANMHEVLPCTATDLRYESKGLYRRSFDLDEDLGGKMKYHYVTIEGRSYLDDERTILLPPHLVKVHSLANGLYIVRKDTAPAMFGIVNEEGRVILPIEFMNMRINKNGYIVAFVYHNVKCRFGEWITDKYRNGDIKMHSVLVSPCGEQITNANYYDIRLFDKQSSFAIVSIIEEATEKELRGIIDLQGHEILPPAYLWISRKDAYNKSVVLTKSACGFFDYETKTLRLMTEYSCILTGTEGLYPVNKGGSINDNLSCEGGLWGFIDVAYTQAIPCEYDEVCKFEEGYAIVCKCSLYGVRNYGVINNNGTIIIPCKYKRIEKKWSFFLCENNYGNRIYIDFDGHVIEKDKGNSFDDEFSDDNESSFRESLSFITCDEAEED